MQLACVRPFLSFYVVLDLSAWRKFLRMSLIYLSALLRPSGDQTVARLSIKLWGSWSSICRRTKSSQEGKQTTAGPHHIRGFRFPRGPWCHVCITNEPLRLNTCPRGRQHPLCCREAAPACALACDLCDYTLAADSGPLLMPLPGTPDSGPFTEQRLIIVLRRRRRTINHTSVFVLSLAGTFDPL